MLLFAPARPFAVQAQTPPGRLSFLHFSADAPALDIYVDGGRVASGLGFGQASAYRDLSAGPHRLTVTIAGRLDALIDTSVVVQSGLSATAVFSGLLNGNDITPPAQASQLIQRYLLIGDTATISSTVARLRVLHASPGSGAFDVRIASADGSGLANNLTYGAVSGYLDLPSGSYTISVYAAGSANLIAQIPGVIVNAGNAYTLVLGGVLPGVIATSAAATVQPFQAIKLTDQAGGPSQPLTTGCNQVILPLAANSPITDVLLRVADPTLVVSIWRFENATKAFHAGYFNDPAAPVDYTTTSASPEAAFICVAADTSWNPG